VQQRVAKSITTFWRSILGWITLTDILAETAGNLNGTIEKPLAHTLLNLQIHARVVLQHLRHGLALNSSHAKILMLTINLLDSLPSWPCVQTCALNKQGSEYTSHAQVTRKHLGRYESAG